MRYEALSSFVPRSAHLGGGLREKLQKKETHAPHFVARTWEADFETALRVRLHAIQPLASSCTAPYRFSSRHSARIDCCFTAALLLLYCCFTAAITKPVTVTLRV
jgi:hypothetical protein